jgi:hypothetical protein
LRETTRTNEKATKIMIKNHKHKLNGKKTRKWHDKCLNIKVD